MSCMASVYVPAPVSDVQNGGGAMRSDSVAAIWPTVEIIRDPYSAASTGHGAYAYRDRMRTPL